MRAAGLLLLLCVGGCATIEHSGTTVDLGWNDGCWLDPRGAWSSVKGRSPYAYIAKVRRLEIDRSPGLIWSVGGYAYLKPVKVLKGKPAGPPPRLKFEHSGTDDGQEYGRTVARGDLYVVWRDEEGEAAALLSCFTELDRP